MITYTSPKLESVLTDQIWNRDCYGIRAIPDPPDVVLDIGANVGSFSLFARQVWPGAEICAYEPFPATHEVLRQNLKGTWGITAYNMALGTGEPVSLIQGHDSGSNRTGGSPQQGKGVKSISLVDMIRAQVPPGSTYVIKLDCEGGEWSMWRDEASIKGLLGAEAVAAELHYRCSKWPDAPPIEDAEAWVRELRKGWVGVSHYHRLGMRAGMLQMRKNYA